MAMLAARARRAANAYPRENPAATTGVRMQKAYGDSQYPVLTTAAAMRTASTRNGSTGAATLHTLASALDPGLATGAPRGRAVRQRASPSSTTPQMPTGSTIGRWAGTTASPAASVPQRSPWTRGWNEVARRADLSRSTGGDEPLS